MRAVAGNGRSLRRAAGVVMAAVLSTTLVSVAGPAAQAAPAGAEVGTVGDITWGLSRADIDRSVAAMTAAGIRWVRANVGWSAVERDGKGVLNEGWLAELDYAVTKARAAGMEVLMPISDGVPYWASADPARYSDASGRHWNVLWRPTNFGDYADFVSFAVRRYKPLGVHTYELWNEPNHPYFWPSGPNPAEYKQLLAAAYPAVKAADPGATVLMGGLSKSDYTYLQGLYAAGGGQYFDAAAVHPYAGSADPTWCWAQAGSTKPAYDAFCAIEEVRRVMEANGDSAKALWLTEMGWSSAGGDWGVSEAVQAEYLTKAFTKLQSYPYVKAAFWYNFRNTYWLNDAPGDYEANSGLLRTNFSAKPAYDAMKAWTGGPLAPPPPTTTTTTAPAPTTTSTTKPSTTTTTTLKPTTTTTVSPTTTTTLSPTTTTTPPTGDVRAPTVSGVSASSVTGSSVVIRWTTNEASDSGVEYWVSTPPGQTVSDAGMVTSHSVTLSGLAPRTKYSFRVRSADAAGNVAVSQVYYFTTKK